MSSSQTPIPGIWSLPRLITILSSLLVALSSGTNYVYSAYAPQLGKRLHINHTRLNLIALGGNMGVYTSGPLWGRIVDSQGPRIPMFCAFALLLVGYSSTRYIYNAGPDSSASLSTFKLCILIVCGYMTGSGGNAGFTGGINATAKTYPDRMRATATSIVLSGFGLSAFFYSSIAHFAFPGDTSSFLLLLAIGTSFPMIFGAFLIKAVPLPPSEQTHDPEIENLEAEAAVAGPAAILPIEDDSQTRLLHNTDDESRFPHRSGLTQEEDTSELNSDRCVSPLLRHKRSASRNTKSILDHRPNVHGRALLTSLDFWLLFLVLVLLSGTGLMYINNVGSMSQALYAKAHPDDYSEVEAARLQAMQVSTVSIMNFAGRILIGILADITKSHFKRPRSFCVVLVAFFFMVSQILAGRVEKVENLWTASALLGTVYGCVFGLFPTVVIEWFGLPHFSENWGFVSLAPAVGGNIFSLMFGIILDAHQPSASEAAPSSVPTGGNDGPQCMQGRECYVSALHLTTIMCFVAVLLSMYAAYRDQKSKVAGASTNGGPQVVWDNGMEDEE